MMQPQPGDMSYPEQLKRIKGNMRKLAQGQPNTMKVFAALHRVAAGSAVLDTKAKELIALAIGVALRCDSCIAFHTHDALEAGATREEILEVLSVAVLMGGGPAVMYATRVVEAVEQFDSPAAAVQGRDAA